MAGGETPSNAFAGTDHEVEKRLSRKQEKALEGLGFEVWEYDQDEGKLPPSTLRPPTRR